MVAGANLQMAVVQIATRHFPAAREHLERAVEVFGPGPLRTHSAWLSGEAQIAHSILVVALVILGYPSTARVRANDLVADGRRASDVYSIAATSWATSFTM
jgi:hypothetical protein